LVFAASSFCIINERPRKEHKLKQPNNTENRSNIKDLASEIYRQFGYTIPDEYLEELDLEKQSSGLKETVEKVKSKHPEIFDDEKMFFDKKYVKENFIDKMEDAKMKEMLDKLLEL
jgi:hypothetical protein